MVASVSVFEEMFGVANALISYEILHEFERGYYPNKTEKNEVAIVKSAANAEEEESEK